MRNWHPFIKEAVLSLAMADVGRVIGIPLAPQFSTLSVQKYVDAAEAAIPAGIRFEPVRSFHRHPSLLTAFAEKIREADPDPEEEIFFTAHSLPTRVIEAGDVYEAQVAETAAGVAERAGVKRYFRAFQSAGRTPEPWIGPDVGELIKERTSAGARRFLIVPIGFVCDHTEVLFDIDVQAAAVARDCGALLRRTESLNTSPTFIAVLEDLVRAAA
jgi:ferrochelatase